MLATMAFLINTITALCLYTCSVTHNYRYKVQTLGAVTLHATTDCTDDASIVGLGPLKRERYRGVGRYIGQVFGKGYNYVDTF